MSKKTDDNLDMIIFKTRYKAEAVLVKSEELFWYK